MRIDIGGSVLVVEDINTNGSYRAVIQTECGEEWLLFKNEGDAEEEFREGIADDFKDGDRDLTDYIEHGDACNYLLEGNFDLDEWIETMFGDDSCERGSYFAHYDGDECEVNNTCDELDDKLGFIPGVAYRQN